jgi:tetratricopeptide (TPR) repeat protein
MRRIHILIHCLLFIVAGTGCKKDFLTENPSSEFITADNLEKISGLLKDDILMKETPVLGEISSDDYYLNPGRLKELSVAERNAHRWAVDIFEGEENIPDWNTGYKQIYYCNVALESLTRIKRDIYPHEQPQWNETYGVALFMRSFAFFNLLQIFSMPYDKNKAPYELGIPMPLSSSISAVPDRSSLEFCYEKIINDLKEAATLLPATISPMSKGMLNKPAAHALLARVYLSQQNYPEALIYANHCLGMHNALIDFNKLDLRERYPVKELNEEVLYQSWMTTSSRIIQGRIWTETIIDSNLYNLYEKDDLRKEAFFILNSKKQPIFRSNYSGKNYAFSGLAIDEMFLIRAECYAREGLIEKAMDDINLLLQHRYKTGTLVKRQATSIKDASDIIWKERRKELVFRGLRWMDLRRLNQEDAHIILTRMSEGIKYELLPGSKKYALPFPPDALRGTAIIQNDRE